MHTLLIIEVCPLLSNSTFFLYSIFCILLSVFLILTPISSISYYNYIYMNKLNQIHQNINGDYND